MKLGRLFVLLIALQPGLGAHAAAIAWDPRLISGDGNVATAGTGVGAFNLGAGGVLGTTVNGVTFDPFPSTATTIGQFSITGMDSGTNIDGGSPAAPFAALSASYRTLLASYATGASLTLTMSGLTPGNDYLFQWWLNDSSSASNAFVTAAAGNSVALGTNPFTTAGGTGQFALGSFVADAPAQTVQFFGSATNAAMLNAFQLRDVTPIPEPSTYALMLAGLVIVGTVAMRRRKLQYSGSSSA